MTVSGSTGAGKSEWIQRLLANLSQMVVGGGGGSTTATSSGGEEQQTATIITAVLYCYGELNANILRMQRNGRVGDGIRVLVHSGLPSEEQIRGHAKGGHLLVVLDDLMVGMRQELLDTLFTRGSHNWQMSVVLVTQHLFSKELRIARSNSHYLVLMRNPAGALQIRTLASQLFPGGRAAHFMEAYGNATAENFGYLLVDMHPSTPDALRLRTHIYPNEAEGGGGGGEGTVVYIPK